MKHFVKSAQTMVVFFKKNKYVAKAFLCLRNFTKQYNVYEDFGFSWLFGFSSQYNHFFHAQFDQVTTFVDALGTAGSRTPTGSWTAWSMSIRYSEAHMGYGYKMKPNQATQRPSARLSRWKSDSSGQILADLHNLMAWAWDLADEIWCNWLFGQIFLYFNELQTCCQQPHHHSGTWIWFFLIPQQGSACFRQGGVHARWAAMQYKYRLTKNNNYSHLFPHQVILESPVHSQLKAPGFEHWTILLWG